MNKCNCCGVVTINPKYCSQSCSAKVSNLKPKRKAKVNHCRTCKKPTPPQRVYCSDCWKADPIDMTLEEALYDHLHRSSAFAKVRSRAKKVTRDRLQVCQHCGYSKHVECCHIKGIKDFPLSTTISEVNHPDNLILLCPNCHWEFDHS